MRQVDVGALMVVRLDETRGAVMPEYVIFFEDEWVTEATDPGGADLSNTRPDSDP
jgi:hypothetical protein